MRYEAILDDLKRKIFFVPQPWWGTFKKENATIFVISIPEAPSIYSHRATDTMTPGWCVC